MNLFDAFINAAAVWFVLKAFEVAPFAVYDLFVLTRKCFSRTEHRSTCQPATRHNRCFDKHRGKLEFVFSGTGFLQFSRCQKGKRLFLVASLVPVLIFILELFSIFLGSETWTCQTSRDPNVVRAPSLQLFGEGEREVSAIDLNNEIVESGQLFRPCLRRHWAYSGVEYVASMCSDLRSAIAGRIVSEFSFGSTGMSIGIPKSIQDVQDLVFIVGTFPVNREVASKQDISFVESVIISCNLIVNGKARLHSNITEGFVLDDTTTEQIRNDVRILENAWNYPPSNFTELSKAILFHSLDSKNFVQVARTVIHAFMSQSRRVGFRTAAEMSTINQLLLGAAEADISCKQDFLLPRTVSIIIIVTAAALRLLLLTVPTPMSSAEYALLHSKTKMNTALLKTTLEEEEEGQ